MQRNFRPVWIAAFFILAVAAVVLLFALLAGRPSYPALPNPNGYDYFVKAAQGTSGEISGGADLPEEELRRMVSANAEPLRLVRQGLNFRSSFPTEMGITNVSATITNLGELRNLARLLRAEGQLAQLKGQPAAAATNYVEALRFGDQIVHGGFIVNLLIGNACQAIGGISLAKLAPGLNCQQVRPLLAELDQLDYTRVSVEEIRRNETQLMVHEMLKNNNPLIWPTIWWQIRGLLKHSEIRYKATVAHERLLMTEMGLRCYVSDHGTVPARLDDLVPVYVRRIPQDPFADQPLVYKVQGTKWLIYSVGPDGVDDGGKFAAPQNLRGPGDLLYDSPW